MHEYYLAQCIVRQLEQSLPERVTASSVSSVTVRVGELDAVVDELLVFAFETLKSECGMPNAQLRIEKERVRCRCRSCEAEFRLYDPVFVCPHCGSGRVSVIQGRGISITELSVETPDERAEHSDHS